MSQRDELAAFKATVKPGDGAGGGPRGSRHGIFKALRHGAAASQALTAGLAGDRGAVEVHARAVRQEFDTYVWQRRMYYASERRWETHGFRKRRRWSG